MRNRKSSFILLGFVFLFVSPWTPAESAEEILQEVHLFSGSDSVIFDIEMQIIQGGGSKSRSLKVYFSGKQGEYTKVLAQIITPPFLNKMKYLLHKYEEGREDKWMSTSQGVRKLSTANRQESVFGSDFTVEDFSFIKAEDFSLQMEKTTGTGEGQALYIVEMTPKGRKKVYTRKVVFVERDSHLLTRVDYYNSKNEIFKSYEVVETQKIGGNLYPKLCRMQSLDKSSETTLDFITIDEKTQIPDRVFNKSSM
jgi:hypothetical protein